MKATRGSVGGSLELQNVDFSNGYIFEVFADNRESKVDWTSTGSEEIKQHLLPS